MTFESNGWLTLPSGDVIPVELDVPLGNIGPAGPPGADGTAGPHTHVEADVTNLVSDLAAKEVSGAVTTHTGLADPHTQYALDTDLTTHAGAADPHTGYRLESADHTHGSSGLQGGTIAYGVITGTPNAERAAASTAPAAIGTAAVGVGSTDARADHVHATGAGTPSTQAMGDAAATGSGPAAAMTDHKHAMPAFATNGIVLGTAAAAGAATTPMRSNDTILAFDATSPSTQAFGDAAVVGVATVAARRDHKHAMPSERAASSSTPAAIGTAAIGVGATDARADHVHATGAGTPSTQAMGDAAATGSGPAASMTDHKHAMPSFGASAAAVGTSAAGVATTPSRSDHVHATGAGSPAASAMGDAAATGTGPAAAMTDHKHARSTITNKLFLMPGDGKVDSATLANIGSTPDITPVVAYADAATQGMAFGFMIPSDWVSGVITCQPVWSPGSTDAVAHTVRWQMVSKAIAAGSTVTAAGTTVTFTGSSSARTVGVVVYDTATSTTLTPAAAGDLFRLTLQRVGGDAADTYVGVVNLLGVIVSYTANS